MTPARLIAEASTAMTADRLDYLERRAKLSRLSKADAAAFKRAVFDRKAHLASPEWLAKVARA